MELWGTSEATGSCKVVRVFSKSQGRGTVRCWHTVAGKVPKIKAGRRHLSHGWSEITDGR